MNPTSPNNINYFQNGMDIDLSDMSDTENINRNLIRDFMQENDEPEEVSFTIDRQPTPHEQIEIVVDVGEHIINIVEENQEDEEEDEEDEEDENDVTDSEYGLDEDILEVQQLLNKNLGHEDDENDDDNEGEYIGLVCIGMAMEKEAIKYFRINDNTNALQKYLFAISLSPFLDCYNEIGTIYEDMGNIEKAKQYYLTAIEYTECILAMYNIADLFRKDMNDINKTNAEYSTKMMLKYYAMAADNGDNEALEMLCAVAYGKDPVKFSTAFKQIMEHRDDHYYWENDYDDDDEDKAIYGNFMKSTSNIEILQMLQKTDTSNMKENEKKHINDCIDILNKETSIIAYNNKISLFKRLNHVVECGICYDENLNIDLHCGHCVCTECYPRLVTKPCPFCRIDSPYGFFD